MPSCHPWSIPTGLPDHSLQVTLITPYKSSGSSLITPPLHGVSDHSVQVTLNTPYKSSLVTPLHGVPDHSLQVTLNTPYNSSLVTFYHGVIDYSLPLYNVVLVLVPPPPHRTFLIITVRSLLYRKSGVKGSGSIKLAKNRQHGSPVVHFLPPSFCQERTNTNYKMSKLLEYLWKLWTLCV